MKIGFNGLRNVGSILRKGLDLTVGDLDKSIAHHFSKRVLIERIHQKSLPKP